MREPWYCRCKSPSMEGGFILRPASSDRCPRCGMKAPWQQEEKERRY